MKVKLQDLDDNPDLPRLMMYALAHGFSREEVQQMREPRLEALLYKAMKFDELCHMFETGKIKE